MSLLSRVLFLLLISITASPQWLNAQFTILPARESRSPLEEKNLTYFLPRHEVRFLVEVRRESFYPGRFAAFSEELLGLKNVVKEEKQVYRIQTIRMETVTEVDPFYRYYIPRPNETRKGGEDIAVMGESGTLIYYGKPAYANRTSAPHDHLQKGQTSWISLTERNTFLPLDVGKDVRDTVFRTIQKEDTVLREPIIRSRSGVKTESELASEIAEKYLELKDSRLRLLTGYQEVNYSGETIEYMDKGLREMMEEYLTLFKGSRKEEVRTYSFTVIPSLEKDSVWIPLFRFSEQSGIFQVSESKGDLAYVRYERQGLNAPRNQPLIPVQANGEENKSLLWYRIPGFTSFELRQGMQIIFNGGTHISQMGLLQSVPYNKLSIEFDSQTGQATRVIYDN